VVLLFPKGKKLKDTPSRAEARQKKKEAKSTQSYAEQICRKSRVFSYNDRLIHEINSHFDRAESLFELFYRLERQARLEDLTVRQNPLIKTTKNGEKRVYHRWIASWREGKKIRVVYLGSINKISKDQALEKAKHLKAQYLQKQLYDSRHYRIWHSLHVVQGKY
jgi:hypothetical protein